MMDEQFPIHMILTDGKNAIPTGNYSMM